MVASKRHLLLSLLLLRKLGLFRASFVSCPFLQLYYSKVYHHNISPDIYVKSKCNISESVDLWTECLHNNISHLSKVATISAKSVGC